MIRGDLRVLLSLGGMGSLGDNKNYLHGWGWEKGKRTAPFHGMEKSSYSILTNR